MKRFLLAAVFGAGLHLMVTPAFVETLSAAEEGVYMVRVTNLTNGQKFTPILAATHTPAVRVFRPGTAQVALPGPCSVSCAIVFTSVGDASVTRVG